MAVPHPNEVLAVFAVPLGVTFLLIIVLFLLVNWLGSKLNAEKPEDELVAETDWQWPPRD